MSTNAKGTVSDGIGGLGTTPIPASMYSKPWRQSFPETNNAGSMSDQAATFTASVGLRSSAFHTKTPRASSLNINKNTTSAQGAPLSCIENRLQGMKLKPRPATATVSPTSPSSCVRMGASGIPRSPGPSTTSQRATSALSKRLNLRMNPHPLRYRTPSSRPLYKLGPALVQTYMKINETYFRRVAARGGKQISAPAPSPQDCDDVNDNYILQPGEYVHLRKYRLTRVVGQGSFGVVVEATRIDDSTLVAIKIIKNRKLHFNMAQTEIQILKMLGNRDPTGSKHIVCVLDSFMHCNHFCIVYELLGQNLYELMHATGFKGIPLSLVRDFSRQLLESLKFLTENQVIHCDIKPENILLQDRPAMILRDGQLQTSTTETLMPYGDSVNGIQLKLIDFGSSCFIHEKTYKYIQSRFYRSPEVILNMDYTNKIDMWSLGCMVVELLCGEALFEGKSEHDQLCRICDMLGRLPSRIIAASEKGKLKRMFIRKGDDGWELAPSKSQTTGISQRTLQSKIWAKFDDYDGATSRTDVGLFVDFVNGLLKLDASERMDADQGLGHAFITKAHVDVGCMTL